MKPDLPRGARRARDVAPRDVPAELERIVRKLLEKDRTRRYASAGDLMVDLRNLQRDRASGTRPVAAGRRASGRVIVMGTLGLLAAVVLGAAFVNRLRAQGAAIGSIAVLPFENATGDPANEYLSDGISESLITKLSSLPGLRVISRTSAFALKGQKLDPIEAGRKLGVDALLLGSLAQRGSSLAISAELVSVRDRAQLWGERYSRQIDDVLQVEGEIAATIARTLRRQLSQRGEGEARPRSDRRPGSASALPSGARVPGRQPAGDGQEHRLLPAGGGAGTCYALAHAGLAEAYTRQAFLRGSGRAEAVGKARASVDRALALDPDLAEARASLGLVRFHFEWDWAGAEAEFRRALGLNPGSGAVREEFGWFLTAMGRLDEGLVQSRKAAELDPLSMGPIHDIAINDLVRGRYEEAAGGLPPRRRHRPQLDVGLHQAVADPGVPEAVSRSAGPGRDRREADRGRRGGVVALVAGATYALCGEKARARQKLDELQRSRQQYVDPVGLLRHPRVARRDGRGAALVREGIRRALAEHGLRGPRVTPAASAATGATTRSSPPGLPAPPG